MATNPFAPAKGAGMLGAIAQPKIPDEPMAFGAAPRAAAPMGAAIPQQAAMAPTAPMANQMAPQMGAAARYRAGIPNAAQQKATSLKQQALQQRTAAAQAQHAASRNTFAAQKQAQDAAIRQQQQVMAQRQRMSGVQQPQMQDRGFVPPDVRHVEQMREQQVQAERMNQQRAMSLQMANQQAAIQQQQVTAQPAGAPGPSQADIARIEAIRQAQINAALRRPRGPF